MAGIAAAPLILGRLRLERGQQHGFLVVAQGDHGLYFSGAYTTGADLQETALYSAMKVAEAVAPTSPKLASLRARMRANGIDGISYNL